MVLDNSHSVSTGGGGDACGDESYNVPYDFKNDEPPRVTDFDLSVLRCNRVFDDFFYLVFGQFDFHGIIPFSLRCKGTNKKKRPCPVFKKVY